MPAELIKCFAKIAEGEVMQLIASDNIKTTEDQYMNIIEAKTAELFSSLCGRCTYSAIK